MNISNQAPAAARSALGRLQQSVINPVVRLAWDLGLPIPGDALLETTGRRTGLRRRTPVCDGLEGERFWLIAQRGRDADWVRNIEHNPRVRVKVSGLHAFWRAGHRAHPRRRRPAGTPADPEPGQLSAPSLHVHVKGAEHEPADNPRRPR